MKEATKKFRSVDEYLLSLPDEVKAISEKVRATIHKAAPKAEELISYNMPAYQINGQGIIYFSAWKKHIGMYPIPAGDASFQKEIAAFKDSKSTAKFPFDQALPIGLISKMVKFRMKEMATKSKSKKKAS